MPRSPIDITGQRFGRLVVIKRTGNLGHKRKRPAWLCVCDCGNWITVYGESLRGNTNSCGCFQRDQTSAANKKHGETAPHTREYRAWQNMHTRCSNPNYKGYKNYGGRGITVCERWKAYENFLADMGRCPIQLTLDRINNDDNYEPFNCRWATTKEQGDNQRRRRPSGSLSS